MFKKCKQCQRWTSKGELCEWCVDKVPEVKEVPEYDKGPCQRCGGEYRVRQGICANCRDPHYYPVKGPRPPRWTRKYHEMGPSYIVGKDAFTGKAIHIYTGGIKTSSTTRVKKPLTPTQQRQQIEALDREGVLIADIAKQLGLTIRQVVKVLKG